MKNKPFDVFEENDNFPRFVAIRIYLLSFFVSIFSNKYDQKKKN